MYHLKVPGLMGAIWDHSLDRNNISFTGPHLLLLSPHPSNPGYSSSLTCLYLDACSEGLTSVYQLLCFHQPSPPTDGKRWEDLSPLGKT